MSDNNWFLFHSHKIADIYSKSSKKGVQSSHKTGDISPRSPTVHIRMVWPTRDIEPLLHVLQTKVIEIHDVIGYIVHYS
jgi:hypothetical protein